MSIYMKIKFQNKKAADITGDVTENMHLDWIQISDVNFGVSKHVEYEAYRNSTANRHISTAQHSEITLNKMACSATPGLFDLSNKADTVTIQIDVTATINDNLGSAAQFVSAITAEKTKLSYIIEGAVLTHYQTSINSQGTVHERISIAYEKMSLKYFGDATVPKSSGFDYIDHKDHQPA